MGEVFVLYEFIEANRGEILHRYRAKVATRWIPPTETEVDIGAPVFLDQLRDALRLAETTSPERNQEGHDRLHRGFTVAQVARHYSDLCQAISDVAVALNAPVSTQDVRILNRCLDDAIAAAVTEHGRERTRSESTRGTERLGFFAHELRNLMNTALMAFEVLKTGNVGVGGSTGAVLQRALMASQALMTRSLAEVRLTQGILNKEPFLIAGLIDEIASASALEADARGIGLTVTPVDGVAVEADRQVLAAVVGNLLQNAFKFTRPRTTVILRVQATADRVLIETQDECGGFASADVAEFFRPFDQRSADRSGLGLGLAFSRWGVEANGGRIHVRNLPGRGCVFTIDLPRVPVSTPATV